MLGISYKISPLFDVLVVSRTSPLLTHIGPFLFSLLLVLLLHTIELLCFSCFLALAILSPSYGDDDNDLLLFRKLGLVAITSFHLHGPLMPALTPLDH